MGSLYESSVYLGDLDKSLDHVVRLDKLAGHSILIVGARGLIGSYLVDMLGRANEVRGLDAKVIAASRNLTRLEERFAAWPFPSIEFVEWDVSELPSFDLSVDYVIHAASNAHPQAFVGDPVGTMRSNIVGLMNVADQMSLKRDGRLLYVSSGEVYGVGDSELSSYDENYQGHLDILSPRSSYPMGKRAAETLCSAYCTQYNLDIVIVRPSHTYGPSATIDDSRANAQFVTAALEGREITLNSAGSQVRSYNYIADAASALFTVLLNGRSGHAYNLANPDVRASIADFAEIVAKRAGKRVVHACSESVDARFQTPISNQVLDTTALEELGWTPFYDLETGIEHTISIMGGLRA